MLDPTWLEEINQVIRNHRTPEELNQAVKAHKYCTAWLNDPTPKTHSRFWRAWLKIS